MLKVTWIICFFPDLKIENHILYKFETCSVRFRHRGINIIYSPISNPYPIILRFLDLLKSKKL